MRLVIVLFAIIAVGLAAPQGDVSILKEFNDISSNSYTYGFEQSDGTKREEVGEVKLIGEAEGIVMRGFYEFIGSDGNVYRVRNF